MTAFVLPFADVPEGPGALACVGGKGANLAWMARAGLPVPPGACVTTAAFAAFLDQADADGIFGPLDALAADDVEGVRRVAAEVRVALGRLSVPPAVEAAVIAAWRALDGPAHAWAVRSSATAEDLPDASFAGQQDTYLNVRGEAAIVSAVRDCWVSLFTDRAVLYRARNGFPHRAVQLSVVLQRMVHPDVAGILFTADPLTGSRATCSIDAGWGLGEALVSGLVNADLYKVDKATGAVREVRVGDKAFAIRSLPAGGTAREALPDALREARALTDAQCAALAAIGRRIEAAAGGAPQDIEWCYEGGALYVVQARPITSLYPLPRPAPDDDGLHVYFSFGHAQMMPEAMPPLARDVWVNILPFGRGTLTGDPADRPARTRAFVEAGGRLYIDVTTPLRVPRARAVLLGVLSAVYPEIAAILGPILPRLGPDRHPPPGRALPILRLLGPAFPRIAASLFLRDPKRAPGLADAAIADLLAPWQGPTPTPRRVRDQLCTLFANIPRVAPPFASGVIAQKLLGRLGVPESALQPLLRALPANVTTEMDLALADLADLARPVDGLAEALERDGLAGAERHPGGGPFVHGFRAFVARYGARGAGEIDLSRPRWRDDPSLLLKVVVGNLRGGEAASHRRRHAEMAAEAEAALARIVAGTPWWRRPLVRRLLHVMRNGLGVREHPKSALVQVFDVARRSALAAGARLRDAGRIATPEDVWFLTWDELVSAEEDRADDAATLALRERIAARREAHARDRKRTPPLVLTSEGEMPTAAARADLPTGALGGLGASAGVVEGRARVVLDPGAEVLHHGEILVAPFTDPGWTPLFTHAAGLVTEVGGMMTHGSVVAREMGIPAVVGVAGATGRIRTGDRVRVHGDGGYVEILAGEAA